MLYHTKKVRSRSRSVAYSPDDAALSDEMETSHMAYPLHCSSRCITKDTNLVFVATTDTAMDSTVDNAKHQDHDPRELIDCVPHSNCVAAAGALPDRILRSSLRT